MNQPTRSTSAVFLIPAFLVFAALPVLGNGQTKNSQIKNNLRSYVADLMVAEQSSGAVAIEYDGKIFLKKGYGLADFQGRVKNRAKTVYHIASMTKSFTTVGIMILQEQGLLQVTDKVNKYVPEIPGSRRITIEDLMLNQSGLAEPLDHPTVFFNIGRYHTPIELLEYFIHEPLRFRPGDRYEYCNANFLTLGLIIERVSGMAYRDFLRERILLPLKMKNTSYDPQNIDFRSRLAVGYDDILSDPPVIALEIHPSLAYAAGGMISTVVDMLKWGSAIFSDQLISYQAWDAMLTPNHWHYGYGWIIDQVEINGELRNLVYHSGGTPGFHGFVGRLIDDQITVVMLHNTSGIPLEDLDVHEWIKGYFSDIGEIILSD